jgi:hypothetical protein
MKFIFPASPMSPKAIDEYFLPQAEALAPEGYCLLSLENMSIRGDCEGDTVVYRGWMLNTEDYNTMRTLVEMRGGKLLTSVGQYLNTHHIPNWYPILREFTPETFIIDNMWLNHGCDVVAELKKLGWEKFFLKDFVKSLKTSTGSLIDHAEDAPKVLELMEKYRGTIEGGLCVRKYEPGLHDEKRCFVINHEPRWMGVEEASFLYKIADLIDSPFFSVDYAYDANDQLRVVEIGDGQVSDLVGDWTPLWFSRAFFDSFGIGLTPKA